MPFLKKCIIIIIIIIMINLPWDISWVPNECTLKAIGDVFERDLRALVGI